MTLRSKPYHWLYAFVLIALSAFSVQSVAETSMEQTGELQLWHKISLIFDGPETSERADYNPFIHYRLNIIFTHPATGDRFVIPGYFAADGNAANTGAESGNKWVAHFSPNHTGLWKWQASFRKNRFVAVSAKVDAGVSGGFMDGQQGQFTVSESNKELPDFRAAGRLQYVNEPYLKFAQSQTYFIKAGPDAPENFLAYQDFDGTFHNDGHKDDLVKTWEPHLTDWKKGDPTWQNGKGKAIIGALNYLNSKGLNAVSFLTMNIMGDDQNVFPYVDYNTYDRMDVSKLAQWEIVFEHAQSLGLFLHFKTQEAENQGLLDGGGTGLQRKLYYRELMARFGHHLALNWNLGEENGEWFKNHPTMPQHTNERIAMARYFYENDPYHHHLVIHNGIDYDDLFSADSHYTGASVQTHKADFSSVHTAVKRLRDWPVINGRPWAIAVDEPGDAQHSLVPDRMNPAHNNARQNGLWGALMAGGWGTEWYFGYANEHSDLTAQDYRSRDLFWDQARHSIAFFDALDVPFQRAKSHDELLSSAADYVLAVPGEFYIVYLKDASHQPTLNFKNFSGDFEINWFNPREGGEMQQGSKTTIQAKWVHKAKLNNTFNLGLPPSTPNQDWVVVVKRK
ncbi:DUF5060 domain-containing protein [Echinimonas agarilytica]|uniref:DUF5060 domain-containing protein n=1 Tax=Echinimonas agarilytica TaxID=1215918 RepID=A0AA41W5W3_9GAMM|nr:DUF5060 domain-containing protein [Echinimonas agarilytica]MCM2679440.1 DUF5060 domain-containing protein [Echinimonas agarilytica]